jgi:hypothetical protein
MNTTTILTIVALFLIVDLTTDAIIIKRMGYSPVGLLKAAWGRFLVRIGVRPKPVPVTTYEPEWDEEGEYYEGIQCDCDACAARIDASVTRSI